MMSREAYKKYFDVLELNPDVSLLEIRNAYIRLKKLYSSDSEVISPIADEFPQKQRDEILKQIEEAYKNLTDLLKSEQTRIGPPEKPLASGDMQKRKEEERAYSGQVLRQIRERMGIELFDVALDTKIRTELLQNIELEKFDNLPPEVYLKGHLSNYASYLMLDSKKVVDDYLRRYRTWRSSKGKE
jgi:curved DNA-binding protein CbpA